MADDLARHPDCLVCRVGLTVIKTFGGFPFPQAFALAEYVAEHLYVYRAHDDLEEVVNAGR